MQFHWFESVSGASRWTSGFRNSRRIRQQDLAREPMALGNVGSRTFHLVAGSFAISLTSGFVRRTDLVSLLVEIVSSFVSPIAGLFTCLARLVANVVTLIFGYFAQLLA